MLNDHVLPLSTNTYSAFGIAVMLPNPMRAPAPRNRSLLSVYQPPVAWKPTGAAEAAGAARASASSAARVNDRPEFEILEVNDIAYLRVMGRAGSIAGLRAEPTAMV